MNFYIPICSNVYGIQKGYVSPDEWNSPQTWVTVFFPNDPKRRDEFVKEHLIRKH